MTQLFDRGMMNQDEGREVFQLPALNTEDSRRYYLRRDYAEVNALNRQNGVEGSEGNAQNADPGVPGDAAAGTGDGQQAV